MPTPTLSTLLSFNGTNGASPYGDLNTDAAGDLFGTTYGGGVANGSGTVFEVVNTGTTYAITPNILVAFDRTNGGYPYGSLITDATGDLFGTTAIGGLHDDGTVFEIVKTGTTYATTPTTLVAFDGTNGSSPYGSLITDAAGDLFGTTSGGGDANGDGTVFEIVKTGTSYAIAPTTLVAFNGTNGASPYGSLITDAAGDLFGTTYGGGANNLGTVFEIVKTGNTYATNPTTLVAFNGTKGAYPYGSLITDAAGDLFGTTYGGGDANGDGTVFEIVKTGSTYVSTPTILVTFNGINGSAPNGSLITDAAGDLFGTTYGGGDANGDGTVFEIAKTGSTYASAPTTLVAFNGTNGANPAGSLITDVAGDLFGTTASGGDTNGDGTVFEISGLCFLAGTRITTPGGEALVERLAVGDLVLTYRGEAKPIVWIGKGKVLTTNGPHNAANVVIVRKNAIADNVPDRDLHVTKGHALYFSEHDGLIPAEFLVNHRSIVWDDRVGEVELYHIELATHDVLMANGAPAESYRDDGNRWLFQNANTGWQQPAKPHYVPVLTGGSAVDVVWQRLLERSGLRLDLPTTDAPDLHLLVDGQRLDGLAVGNGVHVFRLPKPPTSVRVVSRAAAPDVLGLARDPRRLGAALRQVVLWQGRHLKVMQADDPSWCEGFHAFEADNGFRWTDGNARLPAALFEGVDGPCELTLHVACTTRYARGEKQTAIAA
jgi:uncharacterized repeat protein (TIGR03803 family)